MIPCIHTVVYIGPHLGLHIIRWSREGGNPIKESNSIFNSTKQYNGNRWKKKKKGDKKSEFQATDYDTVTIKL